MKPIKGWMVVTKRGKPEYFSHGYGVCLTRRDAEMDCFGDDEKIIRVEIREIKPKPRKGSAK